MKAYKFGLKPEDVNDYEDYLVVGTNHESDIQAEIETDYKDFFGELVGDRYPGYYVSWYEEVPVEEAQENNPFQL